MADRYQHGDRAPGGALAGLYNYVDNDRTLVLVGTWSPGVGVLTALEADAFPSRWSWVSGESLTWSTDDNTRPPAAVVCSGRRVLALDGTCGCEAGFEYVQSAAICRRCRQGTYKAVAGNAQECSQCPYPFSSPRASATCPFCREGFFATAGSSGSLACEACPTGATCAENSTVRYTRYTRYRRYVRYVRYTGAPRTRPSRLSTSLLATGASLRGARRSSGAAATRPASVAPSARST